MAFDYSLLYRELEARRDEKTEKIELKAGANERMKQRSERALRHILSRKGVKEN